MQDSFLEVSCGEARVLCMTFAAGCSPSLGRLLVTEQGLLKSYGEGFSLSDLCRLFDDRPQCSGRASAINRTGRAGRLGHSRGLADLDGEHEPPGRAAATVRGDATELLERELPPHRDEASERKARASPEGSRLSVSGPHGRFRQVTVR